MMETQFLLMRIYIMNYGKLPGDTGRLRSSG